MRSLPGLRPSRIFILCMAPLLILAGRANAAETSAIIAKQSAALDTKFGKTCTAAGCHERMADPSIPRHVPFLEGACLVCHTDHQSNSPGLLRSEGNQVCLACHTRLDVDANRDFPNHPTSATRCLDCHQPHQSRIRGLLRNEAQLTACSNCHAPFLRAGAQMPHHHKFFEPRTQCGNCHYAHTNRQHHLLRDEVTETCLTCHDLPIDTDDHRLENIAAKIRTAPVVHQAIRRQGCPACHTPHGSVQPSLLRGGYPAGRYASYAAANYELCWNCHTKALVEQTSGTTATNFRNGGLNLHRLHVADLKRGRACHLCHEAHAGALPHLLRTTTRFGAWEGPLQWQAQPEGGSCNTPCHQTRSYSRAAHVQ